MLTKSVSVQRRDAPDTYTKRVRGGRGRAEEALPKVWRRYSKNTGNIYIYICACVRRPAAGPVLPFSLLGIAFIASSFHQFLLCNLPFFVLEHLAAMFKAGRYGSYPSYISRAKIGHIESWYEWTDQLSYESVASV